MWPKPYQYTTWEKDCIFGSSYLDSFWYFCYATRYKIGKLLSSEFVELQIFVGKFWNISKVLFIESVAELNFNLLNESDQTQISIFDTIRLDLNSLWCDSSRLNTYVSICTGYSFWDWLCNFLHRFTWIVLSVHKLKKLCKFWKIYRQLLNTMSSYGWYGKNLQRSHNY